jgi:uncharacterized DUF497 family protein
MSALQFDWDDNKAASNLEKHGVSFEEASTVFYDYLSRTVSDPFAPSGEHRFLTLGMSVATNVLMVVHTETYEDHIRIISARRATNAERMKYEQYR